MTTRARIFKSYINESKDTNRIESLLSSFVHGKNIISINQSVVASNKADDKDSLYFMVVTVVYNDK